MKHKGPIIIMDESLRDEFARAAASPYLQPLRNLCLKYNPREHYGMFMIVPKGRARPKECLISVEQYIEEKAKERPYGWAPNMVTFVRMLCCSLTSAMTITMFAVLKD